MKKLALSSQVITGSLTYYHLNLEKRYISNHNINVSITWAEINKGKFLRRYYVILKSFEKTVEKIGSYIFCLFTSYIQCFLSINQSLHFLSFGHVNATKTMLVLLSSFYVQSIHYG